MRKNITVDIIAILFMILFLYTGITKLLEYNVFKEQIAESPILSHIASVIAVGLPILEIAVALMLLFPRYRLIALYLSSGLMVIFTLYVLAILLFAKQLPCSCGGILADLSWTQHLLFNTAFIILSMIGIRLEKRNKLNSYRTWNSKENAPLSA